ncbi:hypothetical protein ACNH6B_04975 [Shewanella basaltis]|uniref:hypothetical protein n=1 Tax=Shewanella basaltis TaxID=472183 RepID=UPI003AAADCE4
MAPAVNGDYEKDLSTPPQGINHSSIVFQKHFYNPLDSSIYKITEYPIKGSEYRGCVEVHILEFKEGDEYPLEYANEVFLEKKDNVAAANEAIDLGIPHEHELLIARYVYANITIHEAEGTVEGKQIRGAFVDNDYAGAKITREVYLTLLSRYGVVVSDSQQSIGGHGLWAFGVCKWGHVQVYNRNENIYLSTLLPNGEEPDKNIKPWSVKNHEQNSVNKLRNGYWTIEDDLSRLVLVLKKFNTSTTT